MSVKIRLQRHGKKGKPFYWIVAADSRVKRDGRLLEKLGTYNPNTNPATIDLDIDGAVKWLQNGAQPTDTAKALLSYKGALLKNHLSVGVRKGALTEEQAEEKFNAWLEEKTGKVTAKVDGLAKAEADAEAKIFAAEKEVNEARKAVAVEEVAPVEEVAEASVKETVEAVVEEAAPVEEVAEAPVEKTVEAVVEEAAPVKEVAETPKEETVEAVVEEAAPVKEVAETPKEKTVEAKADTEVSNEEE